VADRTEHVLAAIDGALMDCEVSFDAMRWTPEPEAAWHKDPGGPPGYASEEEMPAGRVLLRVDLGEFEGTMEQIAHEVSEALGAAWARLEPFLRNLGRAVRAAGALPPPPPPLPDPREQALAHRRSLGAGPDRQVQHRPRPRRHDG
jgi:hypothetical protein